MSLKGKGIFVWRIQACENGDVEAIASLAKAAGFTHVLVKVADGNFNYNIDAKTGEDLAEKLTKALKARKIPVFGWHYVYGYDPKTEADRAIGRVEQLGLDGYVIDAEVEYKEQHRAARLFMDRLRAGLQSLPIGLSSYRFPTLHPRLPWTEFLSKCDFNMPQVYWINARNPGDQIRRSLQMFQKMTPYRPIIPTGAMFRHGKWQPTPEEINEFIVTSRELNMEGVNFWEWSKARRYLPELWNVFSAFDWSGGVSVGLDISQQYIAALNQRKVDPIAQLYLPEAVHVTDARAVHGIQGIRAYYDSLLRQVLPQGVFTLTSYSGTGSVRHLTWTAKSQLGSVQNGSDTIGMVKNKIAYHYSVYSVT